MLLFIAVFLIQKILNYLAIYDTTRITTNKEKFLEFEMPCNMHNVQILKYK